MMARILVVDDDAGTRQAMQLALETAGHEVLTAASQEEGEAVALANRPDLVIVDVMMPQGTEGFHLVWQLRKAQDPAVREVPIIVATGIHQTTALRFHAEQTDGTYQPEGFLPVQGWLDKPIEVEKLLQTIQTVLAAP
jgi:twitching motility two-component system response regulator PilH